MILRSSLRDVQGLQDSSSGLMRCPSRCTEEFYEYDGVSGQEPMILWYLLYVVFIPVQC
jgi:hypothetical protein